MFIHNVVSSRRKTKTSICEFEIISDPLKLLSHNKTIRLRGSAFLGMLKNKKKEKSQSFSCRRTIQGKRLEKGKRKILFFSSKTFHG